VKARIGLLVCAAISCSDRAPTRARRDGGTAHVVPDARRRALNVESMTIGMVHVPAGAFVRGCELGSDPDCFPCSRPGPNCNNPPVETNIDEFYLDRTEVTVGEYAECVDAGHCGAPSTSERCSSQDLNWGKPDRRDHPVNCVTADQAARFCDFKGKHLPTAWQFEKAVRGGDRRRYPWGSEAPTCERAVLWFSPRDPGCGTESTSTVGQRPGGASPYGALDLVGNVMELVTMEPLPVDPRIPEFHRQVLVFSMGGSAWNHPDSVSAWSYTGGDAAVPTERIGFRCAFTPSFVP
jgi:formylglycine-generating enzyme required for sulfatase activity